MKRGNARPINAILSDFRKGEEQALKELQSLYRRPLLAYASRMLDDTSEAEDVIQEVFLKLWTKRATLKPNSQIGNYLFAVVYNRCVSVLRKRKSLKVKEVNFAYGLAYSYDVNLLENEEQTRELWAAISTLPPAQQRYFLSSYVDGENHKEIAERNNVQVQVVKNAVYNALKKLREILGKE